MPLHDWSRVDASIFHAFRLFWRAAISRTLNGGLLPIDFYALIGLADIGLHHVSDHHVVATVDICLPMDRHETGVQPSPVNRLLIDLFQQGRCVSYAGDAVLVQPVRIGDILPDMPLFVTSEVYVQAPLEATYQKAWEGMPEFWRDALRNRAETNCRKQA